MPVVLDAVPETLLWNLYHRAAEARRPDTILPDSRAVELVDAIDFPFEDRFGPAPPALAQWQALRAACFDREVRRFLTRHPGGTVVALGEGLETQFWRVDQGTVRWVSVDLPEAVALRRELLPDDPRVRLIACSALDERWLDGLDTAAPVLVTAQGLLMYLTRDEVHRLLATCATRIPAGGIVFDAVSPRMRDRSGREPAALRKRSVPSLKRRQRKTIGTPSRRRRTNPNRYQVVASIRFVAPAPTATGRRAGHGRSTGTSAAPSARSRTSPT